MLRSRRPLLHQVVREGGEGDRLAGEEPGEIEVLVEVREVHHVLGHGGPVAHQVVEHRAHRHLLLVDDGAEVEVHAEAAQGHVHLRKLRPVVEHVVRERGERQLLQRGHGAHRGLADKRKNAGAPLRNGVLVGKELVKPRVSVRVGVRRTKRRNTVL